MRTNGEDDGVAGVVLEIRVAGELLSAERARRGVIQRALQTFSTEGLEHRIISAPKSHLDSWTIKERLTC